MDNKADRNSIKNRMKRSNQSNTKTVTIETNAYETIDIAKRLFKYDKIMIRARKSVFHTISDEDFQKLIALHKEIIGKFEELEKLGVELKLDREQKVVK